MFGGEQTVKERRTDMEKSLNHGSKVLFRQSHGHLAAVKSHTVHPNMCNTQPDSITHSFLS